MKDQFARNVWAMNLEIQTEAAKKLFITSGNLNWSSMSVEEQDTAMFNILILMATCASPSRSLLIDNPYRSVPKKKLECYISNTEETVNESSNSLVKYVDYLMGSPANESLEMNVLKLDLEASTGFNADTVGLLCEQLKTIDLGADDNAVQTSSIIAELTNRYNPDELTRIMNNEYFLESCSRKIIEKEKLEKEDQLTMKNKMRSAQVEIATERWVTDFVKPEYRMSFLAVLQYRQTQKVQKHEETLLECLGISPELAAERIIMNEGMDQLVFYFSMLYLLTNMCAFPILGPPPTLQEILMILRGEAVRSKLPSLYAVPPLRRCLDGGVKRKSSEQEPHHAKRSHQQY